MSYYIKQVASVLILTELSGAQRRSVRLLAADCKMTDSFRLT